MDKPAPVGFQAAVPVDSADVPEVQDDPAPVEPELPPVADHVERAARDLAVQIWNAIPVPRARLGPANDQCLAHCVSMDWLAINGELVTRGPVDPRPVTVTRIPN